jgi:ATPase complex subunit ATP10
MWKSSLRLSSLADASLLQGGRCLSCQLRNVSKLQPSLRYYATSKSKSGDDVKPATASRPTTTDKIQFQQNDSPSAPQPGDADFVPPALDRPIGTVIPPQEGQNTGLDERSLQQRRDDFVNYDKHIERRKELYEAPSTAYHV